MKTYQSPTFSLVNLDEQSNVFFDSSASTQQYQQYSAEGWF